MIKSILLISIIGITSFIFSDFDNENLLFGMVLPIMVFFSLIAFAIWFVVLFHNKGINQTTSSGGGGDSGGISGFDGGAD